jgi:hypothetical protein
MKIKPKAAKKKLKFSTVSKNSSVKSTKRKFLSTKPPILKKKVTIKAKNNLKLKKGLSKIKKKSGKSVKKKKPKTKTKKKLTKKGKSKKKTVKKKKVVKKKGKKKIKKKEDSKKINVKRGSYMHNRLNSLSNIKNNNNP